MSGPAIACTGVLPAAAQWTVPLSLRVERGTFFTVVTSPGHAATLFRLVLGLASPAEGDIEVLGESPPRLAREPLRRFRRRIGSCLLPDGLIANSSLHANVALPLVFGDGHATRDADARAEEILAAFGLARWADRRPSDLAPDTRQIASLARAVAARPELLLLHDPLTSVSNADAVHLLGTCREYATTVVAAVHGEDEAVCVMADGAAVWDERGCRELVRA